MSVAEDVRPAPLLYEVRDSGVAILTFNRPERMNSWGGNMVAEFYRHIDLAEADPRVRVIVITGAGRAFCAGADLSKRASEVGLDSPTSNPLYDQAVRLYAQELPIVAAIGAFTALIAALIAIGQFDIKRILAYSTISHLGLITTLLGMNSPLAAVADWAATLRNA